MEKILFILFGLVLLTIWIVLLVPQYNALKNKHYRSVAIFFSVFILSVCSFFAMIIYGGFLNLLYGKELPPSSQISEFILCIFGAIFEFGIFFCLWYVYFRKSWDYIKINGYSDKQIRSMVDPKLKRLLKLPQ
jgi:hypothetical protein